MHTIETHLTLPVPAEVRGPGDGRRTLATWLRPAAAATTALLATVMAASGILFLLDPAPVAEAIRHLGYPPYFARALGVAKLLGVAALLAPWARLREWAYAGFAFLLVAAMASHLASGDGPGHATPALLVLGILSASYLLRRRRAASMPRALAGGAPASIGAEAGSGTPVANAPRRSGWFARLVLGLAALLFTLIAAKQIGDPVGASAANGIALGSPAAVTIARVTGAVFLGIAMVLAGAAVSERRLRGGLAVLATVAATVAAVRILGLVVDGPAPFTVRVLVPELVLVGLSSAALVVERRRVRGAGRDLEAR